MKHLHELAQAQRTGYQCAVAFVIQMEGITEVRPNVSTQPEFGTALAEAKAAGVQVLFCSAVWGVTAWKSWSRGKGEKFQKTS